MDGFLLTIACIGAVASIIGAIFAAWRWDYARKAYDLQRKQLYLQIKMLGESRQYWHRHKQNQLLMRKLKEFSRS